MLQRRIGDPVDSELVASVNCVSFVFVIEIKLHPAVSN